MRNLLENPVNLPGVESLTLCVFINMFFVLLVVFFVCFGQDCKIRGYKVGKCHASVKAHVFAIGKVDCYLDYV